MNPSLVLLKEFIETKGGRFVSLVYRNKENELSRYTVMIGVSYRKVIEKDTVRLLAYTPKNEIERIAKDELVKSIGASLTGDNPAYTKQGYYTPLDNRGIAKYNDEGEVYINGFVVKKEVIEAGVYKTVNSSEKTLAKKRISKILRKSKYREFKFNFEQINSASINGKRFIVAQ